ncbi:MAG: tRNA 2-selenouridine(34) synthase MnmH [Ignavibacteriae bacterium]|nr:tRNA 2-selenouridine(34) synthase MnmH [Ignavibacteriota bacterium]
MILATEFKNSKELFEYVRNYDSESYFSLTDLFGKYNFPSINIDDFEKLLFRPETLIIDARSEKEFSQTAIPGALSFPVLNDAERHNVGLVYRKYSKNAAVKLAMEYADPKLTALESFLINNNAKDKKILIYCWRGGGRSKYLAYLCAKIGHNATLLTKGINIYRNKVVNYFNINPFPCMLIELSGLTGCGKTMLINSVYNDIPCLDLEKAARHYSSLFGYVPYKILNFSPVFNQSAFENNLYENLLHNFFHFPGKRTFIIESESKKVGDFVIPASLFSAMQNATSVLIVSSMESRVNRINHDYFGVDLRGITDMEKILTEKERFFRKEISNKHYDSAMQSLKKGDVFAFTELMITNYYDKKYKDKGKKHNIEISADNLPRAKEELINFYRKYTA